MTHVPDNIYGGGGRASGGPWALPPNSRDMGVGPLARSFIYDIIPATLGTALIAALQAQTLNVPLVLTAGAGVTVSADASGNTILVLDVPRNITLTSAGNLSASNFTIVGYDVYGQRQTQTRVGPNANTVATLKAFKSILSVTSDTTSATTVSVGTGDAFGLPFQVTDVGYVQSVKWAQTLAADAGTFVAAVTTDPNTAAIGDVRGTYTPSSASNGTRRLVMTIALRDNQAGPDATLRNAIGVLPA